MRFRSESMAAGIGPIVLMLLILAPHPVFADPQGESLRRVTGIVTDQSGAAVPRVAIEIRKPSGEPAASALTDASGNFAVVLADGHYVIDATAAGLAPVRRQPIETGPDMAPITLRLEIPAIENLIVVTANRTEAPLAQVGSSTTILRQEDLWQAGTGSVAEALRGIAGISIAQNGAIGQLSSVFVRGGESDYTKVLIDGIPVNDPGGSFNFANLPTSAVDRIEIVRGPQSALFGSDAMSGVIQVFTRRESREGLAPKPRLAVEGGNLGTFGYEAGLGGKGDRFDYSASFSRFDTDNDVLNGSFNDATTTMNAGVRPSERSRLRGVFRISAGRAGVPGQWAFHAPDTDQYYRHRSIAGGLTFTQSIGSAWTQTLSYAVSESRQFSEDSVDTGSYVAEYRGRRAPFESYDLPYQTLNQSRRQTFAARSEVSLPHAHVLTAGAEYERETGVVGDPRFDPLHAARNNFGAYVQDQWFFHNRLFAAAGVRLERNASFGFSAAPRASVAWQARRTDASAWLGLTKVKGNFGIGIKEPTLVESFSKSPFFSGNPDLKPERSMSYDLGIEQLVGGGKGAVEIVFFENRYRNQIDFVTTDYTTYAGTFFNTGKSRARGIEVQTRVSLPRSIALASSYTFLDSRILENPAAFDPVLAAGRPLLRRPRHSGHWRIQWQPGRWSFGAACRLVGSRADADFIGLGLDRNPGYALLDVFASVRLSRGIRLFAAANNILNRDYMESLGYPGLPARFRIGLSTGF